MRSLHQLRKERTAQPDRSHPRELTPDEHERLYQEGRKAWEEREHQERDGGSKRKPF